MIFIVCYFWKLALTMVQYDFDDDDRRQDQKVYRCDMDVFKGVLKRHFEKVS